MDMLHNLVAIRQIYPPTFGWHSAAVEKLKSKIRGVRRAPRHLRRNIQRIYLLYPFCNLERKQTGPCAHFKKHRMRCQKPTQKLDLCSDCFPGPAFVLAGSLPQQQWVVVDSPIQLVIQTAIHTPPLSHGGLAQTIGQLLFHLVMLQDVAERSVSTLPNSSYHGSFVLSATGYQKDKVSKLVWLG